MARVQIVNTQIPRGAISAFRALQRSQVLEQLVAPRFAATFGSWLADVARVTSMRYAKRSGKSAAEIYSSARVRGGNRLDSIRGYFLVSPAIAANEYGAIITPKDAQALAIPLPAALYPNGMPKRRGPNSWRNLGTFIYKSKKTGKAYIAYRRKEAPKGEYKLVLLYVLVDRAEIKPKRTLRNTYDEMTPKLYAQWADILKEEIDKVYAKMIEDDVKALKGGGKLGSMRQPSQKPNAQTHAAALLPRYK
jgi:hypothetical protein